MLKLKHYLKPFILGLIASILLLFTQAAADLNLPNFMSDIVNVGIQQSGIEHAAPDAISTNGMSMITSFMTASEKSIISKNYALVSSADQNARGKTYESVYPKSDKEFYIKRNLSKDDIDPIDSIFEAAAHKKAAANNEPVHNQNGIMLAKSFYNELGADINGMQNAYIMRIGMIMLLFALIGGIATILVSLLAAKIATGVAQNLRKDLFDKIEKFSNKEFDKFGTASLITRCTNDVSQMQRLLQMGIRMVVFAPIMGIGGVIMAVNKSSSMSWILGLAVLMVLGMFIVIIPIAMPKFVIIQKLVDKLNLVSRENLSGLMVIRAFGTQGYERTRFEKTNAELTNTNLYIIRLMSAMMPGMMIIMNGLTLLIIWVGAQQIAASSMQVGDMMAYMQYAMQVLMSFMMLSMMFVMLPRAAVSATRIVEVLATQISIVDPENPKKFKPDGNGLLEFKNVCFRYDNAEEDAVCKINFTAKPGQTTAIIGSTGSGKSTLANLALRFYDVSEGQILVDGIDIREVTQKDLRAKIGYVPQEGILLSGTIAFNLRYGNKEASDDEIETAANIAQASEFIQERTDRFDSEISQKGVNVSGGQKQRLSIARALAKNPEILIFDDSFSALDSKTDVALRKALKEHTGKSTVIIIAQRVSSIMAAEQILVLEKGKIVGRGTHRELLENCQEYYEIAKSQFGEGELA